MAKAKTQSAFIQGVLFRARRGSAAPSEIEAAAKRADLYNLADTATELRALKKRSIKRVTGAGILTAAMLSVAAAGSLYGIHKVRHARGRRKSLLPLPVRV
jgi:hypothetical protein